MWFCVLRWTAAIVVCRSKSELRQRCSDGGGSEESRTGAKGKSAIRLAERKVEGKPKGRSAVARGGEAVRRVSVSDIWTTAVQSLPSFSKWKQGLVRCRPGAAPASCLLRDQCPLFSTTCHSAVVLADLCRGRRERDKEERSSLPLQLPCPHPCTMAAAVLLRSHDNQEQFQDRPGDAAITTVVRLQIALPIAGEGIVIFRPTVPHQPLPGFASSFSA